MNKVILTGNLTKDIELKTTPAGNEVVSTSVAVQRDFKNANGEYETDFINIVAWGGSAVYLNKYAKKGDRVEIVGRWQVRSYDDNGKTRYVNECVIENVKAFSKEKKEEQKTNFTEVEDDLPF